MVGLMVSCAALEVVAKRLGSERISGSQKVKALLHAGNVVGESVSNLEERRILLRKFEAPRVSRAR